MSEKSVRAFVDRIEDGYAVLLLDDCGVQVRWPVKCLPDDAVEGSVLRVTVALDEDAARTTQSEIESLIDHLQSGE